MMKCQYIIHSNNNKKTVCVVVVVAVLRGSRFINFAAVIKRTEYNVQLTASDDDMHDVMVLVVHTVPRREKA